MKTTVKGKLLNLSAGDKELLDNLMKRFSSALRYSFNRRQPEADNPITKSDLESILQDKYKLNSRFAKDAINKAESIISSQVKLIKLDNYSLILGNRKLFRRIGLGLGTGRKCLTLQTKLKKQEVKNLVKTLWLWFYR